MKKTSILIPIILSLFSCTEKTKETIFWNAFSEKQQQLFEEFRNNKNIDSINKELHIELQKVNPNLGLEIYKESDSLLVFIITAEGAIELFPQVENLVKIAPQHKNWKIIAFRQKVKGDNFGIQYDNYTIHYSDIFFKYQIQNGQYGIDLFITNYDKTEDMQNAIYILLDNLIGEENVAQKIDWIEWHSLKTDSIDSSLAPIINLRKLIK